MDPAKNELLTRVGRGTPMGELLRRYWLPIAGASELDENPVKAMRLLAEKLLAAGCQPGTLTLHIAQAKCRLFPDMDPLTIYREYGLEDGQS